MIPPNPSPTKAGGKPCPICQGPVVAEPRASHFPFCSQRCQLADLGRWLDGKYAIPRPLNDDDFADPDLNPPQGE